MNNHDSHITSYALNLKVLLVLLILPMTSILVIKFHLGAYTVALALTLASIKDINRLKPILCTSNLKVLYCV